MTVPVRVQHHARRPDAKPQTFRIGDGWFVYNVATNLAQNRR